MITAFLRCVGVASAFAALALAYPAQLSARPTGQVKAQVAAPPIEIFTLDNGLTVIVHSSHDVPIVFVGIWYKVGSKDEGPGEKGIAHLFEHLMFEGTSLTPSGFVAPLEKAGAVGINGITTPDYTYYYSTVPSGSLDLALWLESDRMKDLMSGLDQSRLDKQRAIVGNERHRNDAFPAGRIRDRAIAGIYPPDHPYRVPTIGLEEDLGQATIGDMREWFARHHGAASAVLVLSGDIDVATAKRTVEASFGDVQPGPLLPEINRWVPSLRDVRSETVYEKVPQFQLSRTWPLPPRSDRNTVLFPLIHETLLAGGGAALKRRLISETKIATDVQGQLVSGDISSSYTLTIYLAPSADPSRANRIIDEELARFFRAGPEADDLKRAVFQRSITRIANLETVSQIGRALADGYLATGNPRQNWEVLETYSGTSRKELAAIAETWLAKPYNELRVQPLPEYHAVEARPKGALPEIRDEPTDIGFPQAQSVRLANGMSVIHLTKPSAAIATVGVDLRRGSGEELALKPAAVQLAVAMLEARIATPGTSSHARAFLDRVTAQQVSVEDGHVALTYKVLPGDVPASILALAKNLEDRAFGEAELVAAKDASIAAIGERNAVPARAIDLYLARALFGPTMVPILTTSDVESVVIEDVNRALVALLRPGNLTLTVIAPSDATATIKAVEKSFGRWEAADGTATSGLPEATAFPVPRIILIDVPGAPQSFVHGGISIPSSAKIDVAALTIVNEVMGGSFGSRLNMNLREEKQWTYGIRTAVERQPGGAQSLTFLFPVQTEKTVEAIAEIVREIKELSSNRPITEIELSSVVRAHTNSLPTRFESVDAMLSSVTEAARAGLPFDYDAREGKRLRAATLQEVQAIIPNISQLPVWVVLGDRELLEEALKQIPGYDFEVWDAAGAPAP